MRTFRRLFSGILAALMLLAMSTTAFAAVGDTGFSDVAADAWYAGAVEYVRANGLMSGTSATTFNPDGTTSRGQIATILYRAAGSPAVTGGTVFPDVDSTAYYANATRWASANGIVSGYPNGNFGPDDPITRQQLAAILWRYAGSPAAESGQDFADEDTISAYASTAVDWARANGVISGKDGNLFDPNGRATRAQAAVILHRYMELIGDSAAPSTPSNSKILVAYFSMPETTDPDNMTTEEDNSVVVIDGEVLGNTQYMAYVIQEATGADIFRIEPQTPYPTDHETLVDLASEEQDENARPAIRERVTNMDDYDVVFIGYPIWWSDMPMILYSFFDEYDLSGKTIIPFSTHGGSSFAGTPRTIQRLEPDAVMLDGLTISRNSIQDARQEIIDWVNGLDI